MTGTIDEKGARPLRGVACVLLSGGMDSTACLHWTLSRYQDVRAIGFDYGQPHRDAELVAAGRLARKHSVPFEIVALADALHAGLLGGVPKHEPAATGIHRAFVPGRNLVFLSLALARAATWWPVASPLTLVTGSCAEDADGFPDCTVRFLESADEALTRALDRKVHVAAPYVLMTKPQLVADVMNRFPSGLDDLLESWSCYAGTACGECTACVLRKRALDAHGLVDRAAAPKLHGGDAAREYAMEHG